MFQQLVAAQATGQDSLQDNPSGALPVAPSTSRQPRCSVYHQQLRAVAHTQEHLL
jgi:hypothetical protein